MPGEEEEEEEGEGEGERRQGWVTEGGIPLPPQMGVGVEMRGYG